MQQKGKGSLEGKCRWVSSRSCDTKGGLGSCDTKGSRRLRQQHARHASRAWSLAHLLGAGALGEAGPSAG